MHHAVSRHPALQLHRSVQGSATNYNAINFYREQFGVVRAMLPRVLSLTQVPQVIETTPVEIEGCRYRMAVVRDTMMVEHTPIDYLDFASPVHGLGSKMGLDATNKWPGETQREWGHTITVDAKVKERMDHLFESLGL
jgi:hypothetical protein